MSARATLGEVVVKCDRELGKEVSISCRLRISMEHPTLRALVVRG